MAENAGGPHPLAYGVTTNHVLGLEVVLADGSVMWTGGKEGDLPGYDLTGLLTGLLAQGYEPATAARLGVFVHGLAGDLAAEEEGPEGLAAGLLIRCLGKAFKGLRKQVP